MTFVSKEPAVGLVYKNKKGGTYTVWYHHQGISWHTPVEIWLKDALFHNKVYCATQPINANRIMAVVRAK